MVTFGRWVLNAFAAWRDQGGAVGEEQHPLDPAGAHELVDQRDGDAGLARPGGHHEQGVALLGGEGVADGADGALLVVPPDDLLGDRAVGQREPTGAASAP